MSSLHETSITVVSSDDETEAGPVIAATRSAKRARMSLPRVDIGGCFSVDPIGLGTLPLGIEYPEPSRRPARSHAMDLLHTAFRSGVELLDTGDSYCAGPGGTAEAALPHYVERLIAESVGSYNERPVKIRICTKGGMQRVDSTTRGWRPRVCSRSVVGGLISGSFEALGGSRPIDIYMLHHTNTMSDQQLEDALEVMHGAVKDGTVLSLGLANASVANLQLAERMGVPISVVQNQYSLWQREAEKPRQHGAARSCKKGMLDWCASRGIAFMPYAVCGGVRQRDGRQALEQDFPPLLDIARRNQCSPHALVMAWMCHRYPFIIHIVGARCKQHVLDCASTRQLHLSQADVDTISKLEPRRAPLNNALTSVHSHFIYTDVGDLSNADNQLLTDLSNDVQILAQQVHYQICVDAANNRLIVVGSMDDKYASLKNTLNEMIYFYFGHHLP